MTLLTHPSSIGSDFVVNLFQSSLADPHEPQHCASCLIGCIIVLFHPSVGMQNYEALRVEHPAFLDACARFITVPRSDEENDRLQAQMSVCSCDLSDERVAQMHQKASKSADCSYKHLGWMLACQVHNVLQPVRDEGNLHKVERNQQRAERRGKSVPWPRSPRDVLPYGAEASIAALAVWIEFSVPNSIWLGLFASIIELFKKEVVLPIISSPTLPGKFVGIAEIPFFMLRGDIPSTAGPEEIVRQMKRGAVLYKMLVNFFDKAECRILFERGNAQFASDSSDRNLLSVCRDALAILPILAEIVPPYSEAALDIQHCTQDYTLTGVGLISYLDLPADAAKYGAEIAAAADKLREMERNSPEYTAYVAFMRLWTAERCWAPGCRATFAGAGRAFPACAGCARVTYCSKACQASAWKHPDAPHRAVCKKAKYIAGATGLAPKPDGEGLTLFQVTCVLRNVDRTILEEFSAHFEKLQQTVSFANLVADAASASTGPIESEQTSHPNDVTLAIADDSLGA
ncbi:zinc finger MYND domain-containing protein [Phanerochaete sordida]|uniref:Zinc finger MYND domain-containing protein n=1 Tax=Phanerochaete sordida TaxID=48140 RepID=A0A9P3GNR6_9APHY|nr:zinc finger MYND domain-containing protein [Phanerochaete sordida]